MNRRHFFARIVMPGDTYGLSAINNYDAPLIQFYDTRYTRPQWPYGQPISQYFTKTFMGIRDTGLCMQGGVPEWDLERNEVMAFQDWLVAEIGEKAYQKPTFN